MAFSFAFVSLFLSFYFLYRDGFLAASCQVCKKSNRKKIQKWPCHKLNKGLKRLQGPIDSFAIDLGAEKNLSVTDYFKFPLFL